MHRVIRTSYVWGTTLPYVWVYPHMCEGLSYPLSHPPPPITPIPTTPSIADSPPALDFQFSFLNPDFMLQYMFPYSSGCNITLASEHRCQTESFVDSSITWNDEQKAQDKLALF